jgi:uncharacterized protein
MISAATVLPDAVMALSTGELRDGVEQLGSAVIPGLLSPALCTELRDMYDCERLFRSRVVMARHHYGRGEYKYFAAPLPPLVLQLREQLYSQLAPT